MIKAIGQNGLDFIANKYKELKALIDKKANKTEIITQEERKQLEFARKDYLNMELKDFDSRLKLASDYVVKYPKLNRFAIFGFVREVQNGTLTPPSGSHNQYAYVCQSWLLKNDTFKSSAILDLNMKPMALEQISNAQDSDKIRCLVPISFMRVIDAYFANSQALKATTEYFVKQEDGKALSSNDYTNDDKTKVQNIPTVADNLTTDDATKALSAKQGKALQDNKADKSDISRCKTDGYASASAWSSVSSSRDLEDWIGDFDKRTRELKNGGEVKTYSDTVNNYDAEGDWSLYKIGRLVFVHVNGRQKNGNSDKIFGVQIPREYYPVKTVDVVGRNVRLYISDTGSLELLAENGHGWGDTTTTYLAGE